jgi:hypothetical protein
MHGRKNRGWQFTLRINITRCLFNAGSQVTRALHALGGKRGGIRCDSLCNSAGHHVFS